MKTILVVDDDLDIRDAYAEILSSEGYQVEEAANGRIALEMLLRSPEPPSLMLLDMMMPEMSGAELLDELRESGRLEALPVVMISATTLTSRQLKGTRRYIRKPASLETLLGTVNDVCGPA